MSEQYQIIRGGGGKGGMAGAMGIEDVDSLCSEAFAQVLDLVSEGEVEECPVGGLQGIFFDDTPVQNPDGSLNYWGVNMVSTPGTPTQAPLTGFNDVESETAVGLMVYHSVPLARTIDNTDINAVRIRVSVPQLVYQNRETGEVSGSSVSWAVYIDSSDGNGYQQRLTDTISGKTMVKYERSYTLALTGPGPWTIQVQRTSPNAQDRYTSNDFYWESFTAITYARLRYPHSALVGIKIDAKHFSAIPTRGFRIKGVRIQVPSNYDPVARTYSGAWDGTFKVAWSNNPAWVFYDLVTQARYGLGDRVSAAQVDKWALYNIAQYCDEQVPTGFGGTEPRFTLNVCLQTQEDAYKVINDLASVFRGITYWASGAVTATQDAPADAVFQFAPANVIDGMFEYAGTALKTRHTVALVTWNDPADMYRQKIEYVADEDGVALYGLRETQVVAFGCSSRGQAHRLGRWLLYTSRLETETVSFKVFLEGLRVLPGNIFAVADPNRAGADIGGRILAGSTDTVIELDRPVHLDPGTTYTLSLVVGDTLCDATVQNPGDPGDYSRLTLTAALPGTPDAGAIWTIAQPNLELQLFRCLTVTEDNHIYTVTGTAHNPSKYGYIEDGLTLEVPKISNLTSDVAQVTGIQISEYQHITKASTVNYMTVAWDAQPNATRYRMAWRKDSGNWNVMPDSESPSVDVPNCKPGNYDVRVQAINAFGKVGVPAYLSGTLYGKTAPPSDVTGFTATETLNGIQLNWVQIADLDLAGYAIRLGTSWAQAEEIQACFLGTSLFVNESSGGLYNFLIRAVDREGNLSANIAQAQITLVAPSMVQRFQVVQNGNLLQLAWFPNPETDIDGYELREGLTWNSGTFMARVKSTSYTILNNNLSGTRYFWIKAISKAGLYGVQAVMCDTAVAQTSDRNLVDTIDEGTNNWNGTLLNMFNTNGNGIQLSDGYQHGEYWFEVDIPSDPRARNVPYIKLGVVQPDVTWGQATFDWNSANANRPWVLGGDIDSIKAEFQMAQYLGASAEDIEGIALNGDTTGLKGAATTATSYGVAYQQGRFYQGAHVTDLTQLVWNVNIQQTFNTRFWLIPDTLSGDFLYWIATGTGIRLQVGYTAEAGEFYLEDHLGNRINVVYAAQAYDRILVAVSQTATTRRLLVGAIGRDAAYGEAALPPLGAFTQLRLTQ